MLTSLGRWFNSGSKEDNFIGLTIKIYKQLFTPLVRVPQWPKSRLGSQCPECLALGIWRQLNIFPFSHIDTNIFQKDTTLLNIIWPFDSSVGRAEDCRLHMLTSLGRWFNSGSKEDYFIGLTIKRYQQQFTPLVRVPQWPKSRLGSHCPECLA